MDYHHALKYIYSLTNFEVTPAGTYSSKTFNLERMEHLLAALGHPERTLISLHIAGTKGKGSTAALCESVLRAAGLKTALYTSPHLHTFRERIRTNGEMISPDDVAMGIEKLKPIADRIKSVTTFEVMTALAFNYFAEKRTEIAVLEVGLGGRLDATNVVIPRVSIITPISYEHTAILGNTLGQIASEKAGIIKPSVPTVVAPQEKEALTTIERIAGERAAPLIQVSPDLNFVIDQVEYSIRVRVEGLDSQSFVLDRSASGKPPLDCEMSLVGRHQLVNAACALAALTLLQHDFRVPDQAITAGFSAVSWKGRFEVLQKSPYFIVDGAHNASSMRQLMSTLRRLLPQSSIHLILGTLSDKDINGMFSEFIPYVSSLTLTQSHNPRAMDPAKLVALARSFGLDPSVARDVDIAVSEALRAASKTDIICATGSLFTAAEARAGWLAHRGISVEKD